ncbi:hypothetical protein [Streptomyces zingiberis]|uniref:Uncharacterized protein n=1 Tax=Streptomyces zingiberis TaxID=2053010 RepID=A0ABX1C3Z8_9ACTN|nr:hypothetical protein [Streptomyces zingiberis]NJQ03521.1 hypothetical protein [Streptomyces zingiberis]
MAASRNHRKPAAGNRHPLLSEVGSTVALLADEEDFAAMSGYPPFATLEGHHAYLRTTEELLRILAARDGHTTIALFDPVRFHAHCEERGLDPADPRSRARYTAEIASAGATVPYDGKPLPLLLPLLVDAAERRAGLELATLLLATAGDCPRCGEDLGRTACARATAALTALVGAAGPGAHHLVCSVPAGPAPLTAVLHAGGPGGAAVPGGAEGAGRDGDGAPRPGTPGGSEGDTLLFCTVLAAGLATGVPGGIVLRTLVPGGRDRVRGWSLRDGWPRPLTAAEVFTAYCTDPETGEPVPPEPGVDHLPGLPLPEPEPCCPPDTP